MTLIKFEFPHHKRSRTIDFRACESSGLGNGNFAQHIFVQDLGKELRM